MKFYNETLYDAYGQRFSVDQMLFEHHTEHQHLVIFKNAKFGRIMALDGIIQTTEADEFIYHEMLAHVPIFAHGDARRVLIIGGGDGGMLREVCKHSTIEHITQVEIDQQVIDMCKTYLPKHSAGAYDDPRVNIVINDGLRFVRETDARFDVIISDGTDPIGPGESLFSNDYYAACKRCLNPGGVLVTQNGVAFMQPEEVTTTYQRMQPHFVEASFYTAAVPTYVGGVMTFAWASDDTSLKQQTTDALQARFDASNIETRYYTPAVHAASFALPRHIQALMP